VPSAKCCACHSGSLVCFFSPLFILFPPLPSLLIARRYAKYERYLLRSFVDDNPLVKWCPAPGCVYAIRSDLRDRREAVVCKCGFRFCFQCSDSDIGDHMPATCHNVEEWLEKASDESENVNWLMANTKRCPECRSPIEKNGGCMVCAPTSPLIHLIGSLCSPWPHPPTLRSTV
jgi:IBR domain, a half RING-finger domain